MHDKGVIIGKFYPPHNGHHYLIETAEKQTRDLTVIVCGTKKELIDPILRVNWLRQIHPKVKFKLIYYQQDLDDPKYWAELTTKWLGYKPDAVFTSENYGDSYANYMNAKHISVDIDRKKFNISGTQIRQKPLTYFEFMKPLVRAHFVKKICVVGAESTGTTTVAQELAKEYNTVCVPEYGRTYYEKKQTTDEPSVWKTEEFVAIAKKQSQLEDEALLQANKILISDTDAFATAIWHKRYMGFMSNDVASIADSRRSDIYFVTGDEIPFVQDGTRDGEHIRHWMHQRFIIELESQERPFALLKGSVNERIAQAKEVIDKIIDESALV